MWKKAYAAVMSVVVCVTGFRSRRPRRRSRNFGGHSVATERRGVAQAVPGAFLRFVELSFVTPPWWNVLLFVWEWEWEREGVAQAVLGACVFVFCRAPFHDV